MATVQRYVNTSASNSAGGNGTDDTVTSGGNQPYQSLSSWEANSGGSATDDYIVDCFGDLADTTLCNIDFATNITTGSVLVRGHRGKSDGFYTGGAVISSSHYRIAAGNQNYGILINELNTTIDGVQIEAGQTTSSGNAIRIGTTGTHTVRKCRLRNTASTDYGISSAGADLGRTTVSVSTYENNLVVGFDVVGIDVRLSTSATSPTIIVQHNTVYGDGSSIGIRNSKTGTGGSPTFTVKGNVCSNGGASTDIVDSLGAGTITYDDNVTDDFDLGTTGEIELTPGADTDADVWTSPGTAAASDFTLLGTAVTPYQVVAGTLVATDICDVTRTGTNYDAGCFAFIAGGGGPTTYYKSVAGSITLTGALTDTVDFGKALTGSITATGVLSKKTKKSLAGSLTGAGALLKKTQKALAGSITATGALASGLLLSKAVAGSLTLAGALATSKFLTPILDAIASRLTHLRRYLGRR